MRVLVSRQIPPAVAHHRARVANAVRRGDDQAATEHRRQLKAAVLEDAIRKTVEAAPLLSDEQRARLAQLLRPAVADGHCCGAYGVDQLVKGIGCPEHTRRDA